MKAALPGRLAVRGTSRARRAPARAGTVSVRAARNLVELGTTAGIGRPVLMEAAAIRDADLRDADAHLPIAATLSIWQVLAKQIRDPGFPIRAGATLRIRQLGLLGYVACFSATLRSALKRVERFGPIFTEESRSSSRREGRTLH